MLLLLVPIVVILHKIPFCGLSYIDKKTKI